MNSSRQLLLGVGVFFGGTILLYAMLQMEGSPHSSTDKLAQTAPNSTLTDTTKPANQAMLTADIETETRILAEKRRERESRVTELDQRAKTFLEEQERAELLAMEKARLENQKYRNNGAEPIVDAPISASTNSDPAAQSSIITKPVVTARATTPVNADDAENAHNSKNATNAANANAAAASSLKLQQTKLAQQIAKQNKVERPTAAEAPITSVATTAKNKDTKASSTDTDTATAAPKPKPQAVRTQSQTYTVQPGDGLIKLSRRYNVPLDSLLKANGLGRGTSLVVGQKLIMPGSTSGNSSNSNSNGTTPVNSNSTTPVKEVTKTDTPTAVQAAAKAPAKPGEHEVGRGDGLIKLARQYDVPVAALAVANNINANSALHVGQTLKIPSRSQVARLEREAAQQQAAQVAKREAQARLDEARRQAKTSDAGAQESFGVQVALADSQEKAEAVVKQMQAAGYKATTSQTSRGVRVIVGPEKGKEAALALKDKLNADTKANVDGAWVLGWR